MVKKGNSQYYTQVKKTAWLKPSENVRNKMGFQQEPPILVLIIYYYLLSLEMLPPMSKGQ